LPASRKPGIVFSKLKKMDDLDALILFSGTWVWAAHLVPALRDFAGSGKGLLLWTNPGSQGWRPVGGLVMHGGLKEVGIPHRFVYGGYDDPRMIQRIVSYCRASHEKSHLNMSTAGVFGGRGMGQTCGVADPSQWMRVFGVDIDSRDTTLLLETARAVPAEELVKARAAVQPLFSEPIPQGELADRALRLYLAIKKILVQENWDFYTIQSFPGLSDDYSATCLAQSLMLNEHVGSSTLSDFNTLMTVKLLTDLSIEPVYYGDLQHIDKSTHEIKIIGDGACPPSLAGRAGPARFAEHGIPTEGEAGGISVDLVCKPGMAFWHGWEGIKANSNWWLPDAPFLNRPRNSWSSAAWSVASRAGRMPLSPPIAISSSSWKPGITNMPFWAMVQDSTRICWHSAS